MDKFSYYDTLGTLVPGLFLIWALPILGPIFPDTVKSTLTGSAVADAVIILAVSYVAGHVLQFLSRYSIEPIIKRVFWNGELFSRIYLVKVFGRCPDVERIRFLEQAKLKLAYTDAVLQTLDDPEANKKGAIRATALEVSDAICRALDAKTLDASLALKAHIQNTMYSLLRNLSAACLLLSAVNLLVALRLVSGVEKSPTVIGLDLLLALVFLLRARQRGELYVKGLFWSYV